MTRVLVVRHVLAALFALALISGCAPSATPAAPTAAPAAPTAAPKPTAAPVAASPAASPATLAAPSPSPATQPAASPAAASPSPVAKPAASPAAAASPSPAAAAPQPTAVPRTGSEKDIILATTTSTQDSGLLDVLVPLFEQQTGYNVKTVSVGTGAALALGARGEADVVLVHAPPAEVDWMAQGNGTERLLVMHNDFIIVGPPADPAKIMGDTDAVGAMKKIADAQAPFVSRGDNSGTNQFELALWQRAGVNPKGQPWYIESGTGMGQTLILADQKEAYTISDRATYLAFKDRIDLPIMVEHDPSLLNVYHVMPVNPAKFPNVPINTTGGKAFADFMVAPDTQQVIGDFGKDKYGQQLFVPDAGKSEADVGL
jgi:tungstate transport system substrate-binding protein